MIVAPETFDDICRTMFECPRPGCDWSGFGIECACLRTEETLRCPVCAYPVRLVEADECLVVEV